jgi:hypothetical protein
VLDFDNKDDLELAEIYFTHKYKPKYNLIGNSKYMFVIKSKFTLNDPELDSMIWNNADCINSNKTGYYIYFFISKENKPIYIGKTRQKIKDRMNAHNHLPCECYSDVDKICYGEVESEADLAIYETYYINKYKPKYNTMLKYNDKVNIKLPDLKFDLLK